MRGASLAHTEMGCGDAALDEPGAVAIATAGQWMGWPSALPVAAARASITQRLGRRKPGHTTTRSSVIRISRGALSEKNTRQGHKCSSSRNGWRGLFYVIDDKPLSNAVKELIEEGTAH